MAEFNFDIIGKRKYFFIFSIALMIAGLIAFFVNGIQLDIQFQGGTMIEMQIDDPDADITEAESIVSSVTGKRCSAQKLQTLSADKSIDLLKIDISGNQALSGDEVNSVVEALRKEFSVKEGVPINVLSVQPLIGKEMLNNGVKAIIWACVLMIIYIWFRFRTMANSGLSAGITAVIALLHDALVMLIVYIVFRMPLNESFIAAVLTILGFSINDTIIIYDRIRENIGLMKKTPLAELVNRSIMQTLSRSINTSVTVLICILVIFIYSSVANIPSLKEFSLPLIIGILSGTYSTLFIASPLWVIWKESQRKGKTASKTVAKAR